MKKRKITLGKRQVLLLGILNKNKDKGFLNLKRQENFYRDDTALRRLANYYDIRYKHTVDYKIFYLKQYAPSDSGVLKALEYNPKHIQSSFVGVKSSSISKVENRKFDDTFNVNVTINFNYWILLVILLLLLLIY